MSICCYSRSLLKLEKERLDLFAFAIGCLGYCGCARAVSFNVTPFCATQRNEPRLNYINDEFLYTYTSNTCIQTYAHKYM